MAKKIALAALALVCALNFNFNFGLLEFGARAAYSASTTLVNSDERSSSAQMMENIEMIIYGETSKGGIIARLAAAEEALFGRSLPGTIAERHAAILNFLEVGTETQPSMIFQLGVAEWITNKHIDASKAALARLETLEMDLDASVMYDGPIAIRVGRALDKLLTEPVTFQLVNLPSNVPLKLRFLDELNPATNRVGDSVRLELTDDLIVNQCLVAPAGSLLITEVREVVKPRMFGIPGEVRLSYKGLKPLGPQYPMVAVGEASKKAIENARKTGDRGEGAVIGASAVSVASAALLGPVGLAGGLFIRGNSLKVPVGSITFVQTSGDIVVSAWPLPSALQARPEDVIESTTGTTNQNANSSAGFNYDPDRDTIIKADVFNRTTTTAPAPATNDQSAGYDYSNTGVVDTGDTIELPPEQNVGYY